MNKVTDKFAFITGGTQGLGAAIAREFANNECAGIVTVGRKEKEGKEVANKISKELVISKAITLNKGLKEKFKIKDPNIKLLGLNPHSGEGGKIGNEEIDIIIPAVKQLRKDNITVIGPLPADTLFNKENLNEYDARLCMFHDQALIPIKTLDFFNGINFTAGLSFIRTSPDHGTAFNISGKNIANPASLISSIKQAKVIAKNRQSYGK